MAMKEARVVETKHAHKAAALAKFNPDGVQLAGAGERSALSLRERALLLHHTCKFWCTQLDASAAAGAS